MQRFKNSQDHGGWQVYYALQQVTFGGFQQVLEVLLWHAKVANGRQELIKLFKSTMKYIVYLSCHSKHIVQQ